MTLYLQDPLLPRGELVTLAEEEGQDTRHPCCPQGRQGVLAPVPARGRNSWHSPPPCEGHSLTRCFSSHPGAASPQHHPGAILALRAGGTQAHQRTESLEHRGDDEVMVLQPVLVEQDQVQHCQRQTPMRVNPGRSCWVNSENVSRW